MKKEMGEKFAKLKDENKILVMLAFFSISKGLWENFRQLWLQDNMLNVTQISQILSIASLCCVVVLIILAKRLLLIRIRTILLTSFFIKGVCLILLYILNHTGYQNIIIVILDTIFERIIVISIYPFIVSIKKDDRLYSKRKLVEYLFSDIGILVGGILIGKTLANILIDYNVCLLISIVFLILAIITILNIKRPQIQEKQIQFKEVITYILKDKIVRLYIVDYFCGQIAMKTGLGLKMLMLTNILNFSAGNATNYLLLVGLIADLIGIIALKYLTGKNDYITVSIKFEVNPNY